MRKLLAVLFTLTCIAAPIVDAANAETCNTTCFTLGNQLHCNTRCY